jgi:hypothetical protein
VVPSAAARRGVRSGFGLEPWDEWRCVDRLQREDALEVIEQLELGRELTHAAAHKAPECVHGPALGGRPEQLAFELLYQVPEIRTPEGQDLTRERLIDVREEDARSELAVSGCRGARNSHEPFVKRGEPALGDLVRCSPLIPVGRPRELPYEPFADEPLKLSVYVASRDPSTAETQVLLGERISVTIGASEHSEKLVSKHEIPPLGGVFRLSGPERMGQG